MKDFVSGTTSVPVVEKTVSPWVQIGLFILSEQCLLLICLFPGVYYLMLYYLYIYHPLALSGKFHVVCIQFF